MCDTMYITPEYSSSSCGFFAKNSDRSPNEPLLTLRIPAMHHEAGSVLHCTYIDIPQVEHTREMILCKPSWIWGAEMGINDAQVTIGNEAVFTKTKRGEPSLIGMDLLRLALERSSSASAAVEILIALLGKYGQGGNCGFDKEFYYDNSFLICDPREGFVLETSGKNYAVLKIKDKYAISNRLSIESEHTMQSGIASRESFARKFTEPVQSLFSQAKNRRRQSMEGLAISNDARDLVTLLRSHDFKTDGKEFSRGSVGSICMHAGGIIGDHTTGSLVVVFRQNKPTTLWITGSSTPCISAFKPVFWNSVSAPLFEDPSQSAQYWLKREHLHRAILAGKVNVPALRKKIRELEARWFETEELIMNNEVSDEIALATLSAKADREEQSLINTFYREDWWDMTSNTRYARYWKKKNEKLGFKRA